GLGPVITIVLGPPVFALPPLALEFAFELALELVLEFELELAFEFEFEVELALPFAFELAFEFAFALALELLPPVLALAEVPSCTVALKPSGPWTLPQVKPERTIKRLKAVNTVVAAFRRRKWLGMTINPRRKVENESLKIR